MDLYYVPQHSSVVPHVANISTELIYFIDGISSSIKIQVKYLSLDIFILWTFLLFMLNLILRREYLLIPGVR